MRHWCNTGPERESPLNASHHWNSSIHCGLWPVCNLELRKTSVRVGIPEYNPGGKDIERHSRDQEGTGHSG